MLSIDCYKMNCRLPSEVSISISAETLKQLNAKIDELRALLNSLTPVVADTKIEPKLVLDYYDKAKTMKYVEYYTLNNARHGKSIQYFQNGTIHSIWNYNNDKPHGICIYYNEDGSVKAVRKFENGELKSELACT